MTDFKDVLTYGTYYPQAWHHYPHLGKDAVVICDKCRKQPLQRCIGFKDLDLCLACAFAVEANMVTKPVYAPATTGDSGTLTFMAPYSQPSPETRTNLHPLSSMALYDRERHVTRMAPYDRERYVTKMAPYR